MKIVLEGEGNLPDYGEVEPDLVSDFDDAELTLRRKVGESLASSFSSNMTFYGSAFEYLKSLLIDSDNARNNVVLIKVYDSCCLPERLIYTGKISAKTIDWCEIEDGEKVECAINASSEEFIPVDFFRKSLISKNNTWTDGVRFWERVHQQIPYCIYFDPEAYQYAFMVIFTFITLIFIINQPLFILIATIVGIINAIIGFLGSLFGGDPIDNPIEDFIDGFTVFYQFFTVEMPKWVTGCGVNHYAPLVRDYIQNAIEGYDASIVFESSILNNPNNIYYNMVLLYSPNDKGEDTYFFQNQTIDQGLVYKYMTRNSPNWTLGELLDKIKVLFNAEWWVDGNVLRFEKRSTYTRVWLDLTAFDESIIINKCFSWDESPFPTGLRFQYQQDGADRCTNKSIYLFNDTVPFEPAKANQDKLEDVLFQFAPVRARGDGVVDDLLVVLAPIFDVFGFFGLDPVKPEYDKNFLLSSGMISTPRLVILENGFKKDHAIIHNKPHADGLNFNSPMWVDAAYPFYNPTGRYDNQPGSQKRREGENLFQFFQDRDPINQTQLLGRLFEFEIKKDCDMFEGLFDADGRINFNISLRFTAFGNPVVGLIQELSIKQDTFIIKGIY